MPHYRLFLHDHVDESLDVDLTDDAAARIEAIRFAGELLRDQPGLLDQDVTLQIVVADDAGAEQFRIEMRTIQAD